MKHVSILVPAEQTTMSTVACVVGTYQLLAEVNKYKINRGEKPLFEIALVGATPTHFLDQDFLSIRHQFSVTDIEHTQLIIIPASSVKSYESATKNNRLLIDWITMQYKQGAEIASMCIGSFMLAATGLLTGKTCSTHWALSENFKSLYPGVNLQTDKLITDDNGIYTNGGAYSFLHLLLYLIEKFDDRSTAIHCAKYFQVDLDRELQAEFSIFSGHKKHNDEAILAAQKIIEEKYQDKISIEKLSAGLHIGRRNFDRRFIKATGLTPLDYLQRVKVEAAKRMFETTRKTVTEVMYDAGYNDVKAFREVFSRITGLSPLDYKVKYNKEGKLVK